MLGLDGFCSWNCSLFSIRNLSIALAIDLSFMLYFDINNWSSTLAFSKCPKNTVKVDSHSIIWNADRKHQWDLPQYQHALCQEYNYILKTMCYYYTIWMKSSHKIVRLRFPTSHICKEVVASLFSLLKCICRYSLILIFYVNLHYIQCLRGICGVRFHLLVVSIGILALSITFLTRRHRWIRILHNCQFCWICTFLMLVLLTSLSLWFVRLNSNFSHQYAPKTIFNVSNFCSY